MTKQECKPIDCDRCGHFIGRSGWARVEFRCAKGQQPESPHSTMRYQGCTSYREASRDVQIYRRFKDEAAWHGDGVLKAKQALARRTASSLSKTLSEFSEVMSADQARAGRDAVAALQSLADDIQTAARMAKAHKAREEERREAERQTKGDRLADQLLTGQSEKHVIELAEQLAALDTAAGRRWLDERHGRSILLDGGVWVANDLAQRLKPAQGAARSELFAELRRAVAEALQSLNKPLTRDCCTRADFDAWCQLQRHRAAATASVKALVRNVMNSPGEQP